MDQHLNIFEVPSVSRVIRHLDPHPFALSSLLKFTLLLLLLPCTALLVYILFFCPKLWTLFLFGLNRISRSQYRETESQ